MDVCACVSPRCACVWRLMAGCACVCGCGCDRVAARMAGPALRFQSVTLRQQIDALYPTHEPAAAHAHAAAGHASPTERNCPTSRDHTPEPPHHHSTPGQTHPHATEHPHTTHNAQTGQHGDDTLHHHTLDANTQNGANTDGAAAHAHALDAP